MNVLTDIDKQSPAFGLPWAEAPARPVAPPRDNQRRLRVDALPAHPPAVKPSPVAEVPVLHGFKILKIGWARLHDGRLVQSLMSVYSGPGAQPYQVGEIKEEQAQPGHKAGFFFFPKMTVGGLMDSFIRGDLLGDMIRGNYAVVSVETRGPWLAYGRDGTDLGEYIPGITDHSLAYAKKLAASWMRVERIVDCFSLEHHPRRPDWRQVAPPPRPVYKSPSGMVADLTIGQLDALKGGAQYV